MKRVLHLITRLDPGGSTTNTLLTVAGLDKSLYEVYLVAGQTFDPSGTAVKFIRDHGINFRFCPSLVREINPWKDMRAFFALRKIIREGKYDLVHTHSSKAGILGRWAAYSVGVRTIVHTPHGHVFYGYFSRWVTAIFRFLEQGSARITTRLVALTLKGVEEHLALGVGCRQQWVAIPSGIDTDAFKLSLDLRAAYRQKLGFGDQDIILVCAARLTSVKNHRVLMDALVRLKTEFPSIKLLFLGEGPEREMLTAYARDKQVAGDVVFAGFRQDLPSCLSACDIFVMASLNEGLGRSVLEAMSVGLPVVVSNVGGLPSVVADGEHGLLVSPHDVDGWVGAVVRLIKDPALRLRLSRAAKSRVQQEFSAAQMIRQIEELYAGVL